MREHVQEWVGNKAKKYIITFVTVNITSLLTLGLKCSGIQHRSHRDGAVREEEDTS